MAGALDGIRVADFSRVVAGPVCSQTLADLGADVVKIEHPVGGDDTRGYRPPDLHGLSPFFISLNRNKRSVAIDLQTKSGQAVARALCDRADVVLENFSTGVMARFGLDYPTISANHPELVYCSTSAYGREGPYRDRAGYDPVVQAESGFMSMTGEPDGEPVRTGIPMIDVTTGMTAAQAVLAALFHRIRTGRGQFVEVPLFDTGYSMTTAASVGYLASGRNPTRSGNGSAVADPTGVFHCSDGATFYLSCAGDRVWRKLCNDVLERPDLASHPDYAANSARVANKAVLLKMLDGIFRTRPRDEWVARMRKAGVPGAPIRSIPEAFASEEAKARGNIGTAPNPAYGEVPNVRSPLILKGTPVRAPVGAPLVGQHTDEVLGQWLGYDGARIAALKSEGACK